MEQKVMPESVGLTEIQSIMAEFLHAITVHQQRTGMPRFVYLAALDSVRAGLLLNEAIDMINFHEQAIHPIVPASKHDLPYIQ